MNVCGLVRVVCVQQTGESNAGRCKETVQNADGYLMAELMGRCGIRLVVTIVVPSLVRGRVTPVSGCKASLSRCEASISRREASLSGCEASVGRCEASVGRCEAPIGRREASLCRCVTSLCGREASLSGCKASLCGGKASVGGRDASVGGRVASLNRRRTPARLLNRCTIHLRRSRAVHSSVRHRLRRLATLDRRLQTGGNARSWRCGARSGRDSTCSRRPVGRLRHGWRASSEHSRHLGRPVCV
jgi:hypothetical protein